MATSENKSAGPIVRTTGGDVQGFVDAKGVLTFRGIPYAADTGGANRFLPPKQREPWQGVRDATQWAPQSPQAVAPAFDMGVSEDCLVVNIWTNSISGKRPVMVYIHGGAWRIASGNQPEEITLLQREDVVFVRLQHRLGPFGFLSLGEAFGRDYVHSGNVGMMDIRMALEWVRDNIAQFGGDSGKITFMGESGGGAKTLHALAMPMFKGLIHRAIIIGGHDLWKRNSLASARKRSGAILAELGVKPGDIGTLQALPMVQLLEAHNKVIAALDPDPSWGARPWISYDLLTPSVDGETLPEFPIDALAHGASADVSLMLGTTKVEHWLATAPSPNNASFAFSSDPNWGWLTRADLLKDLQPYLGDKTAAIVAAYEAALPGASPSTLLQQIVTDRDWRLPHLEVARAKAAGGGKPAYLYFNDADYISGAAVLGPPDVFAGGCSGQVARAYARFGATGDPNHGEMNMPHWEPYTAKRPAMMAFGLQTHEVVGDDNRGPSPLAPLSIWKEGRV